MLVLWKVTFNLCHMPLLPELLKFSLIYEPPAHAGGYKDSTPSGLLRLEVFRVGRIIFLALSMLFIVPLLLRGFF